MEKILTPETAKRLHLIPNGYDCQVLDGGDLLMCVPKTGEPFDTVLPNRLPIDRDGDVFIPGLDSAINDELDIILDSVIRALRLGSARVKFDVSTGNYRPGTDVGRPQFRPVAPNDAAHILVVIDYFGETANVPALIPPDSDLGQSLHLITSWRVGPFSEEDVPQDFLVIDKQADQIFQGMCAIADAQIADEIIAGDVFAATCAEASAVYRRYMEQELLPQLSLVKGTPIVLTPKLQDEYCELWCHDPDDGKDKIFDIYDYTLAGAQSLAKLIKGDTERRVNWRIEELNF